jgi:DNA-directed RNA polymerase specialized sigma24 family protein
MENINLIRKLAWSFHKTTGMSYDELFSEASIYYLESFHNYQEDSGLKFETWAVIYTKRKLIDFCKKEQRRKETQLFIDFPLICTFLPDPETVVDTLSGELKKVAEIALNKRYRDDLTPAKKRNLIKQELLTKFDWSPRQVKERFTEMKMALN